MTCTRCKQDISFNQWYVGTCARSVTGFHKLSEEQVRLAYHQMLEEAAYSRSQP